MEIKAFQIEHQGDHCFLAEQHPAFSWKLISADRDVVQSAYQIRVSSVFPKEEELWDSGIVSSRESLYREYEGKPLEPQTEYQAKLQVWDNYGNTAESSLRFETSLYQGQLTRGKWITYPGAEMDACPIFVRRFRPAAKVARARVYASACGIYKLQINGERIGRDLLTPGWTEYRDRILFQTYDVTGNLQSCGEEASLEMTVAKGWYSGIYNFFCTPHIYGEKAAAFLELHIWYADGTKSVIGTDDTWKYTSGENRYAEIYHGQTIDYTWQREPEKSVEVLDKSADLLQPQEGPAVRIHERFQPVAKIVTPKGETVLDFGQNMAGIVCARLKLRRGQKVTLRHAETLDENSNFYTTNLRQARATDVFIGSGEEDCFLPEFTYHGFRYVCVEGMEEVPEVAFTACAIYSDMAELCDFTCSHPLLNRLYQNIRWGQKSNFVDIPTDCPQRDERLGWTGDAGVFSRTAAINMDAAQFFKKWLKDLEIAQGESGMVPAVVPDLLGDSGAGAAVWGDCVTMIPWNLYQIYGDKRILRDRYDSMKAWVGYLRGKAGESDLMVSGFQYGDWLALDKEGCLEGNLGGTNEALIGSIFYGVSVKILADSAVILGYDKDAEEYRDLFERIKKAVNREFMTAAGRIVSDTETAYVLMFWFDMLDDRYADRMKELFVQNLDKHQNKLSTGFAGTPFLCYALHKIGRDDLAGKIVLTEECPGWLYAVKKGATTVWERWDSIKPDGSMEDNGMNSLNHYAYGSIGSWLVEVMGGVSPAEPGYRTVKIAPAPIQGITGTEVTKETPYGTVRFAWRWEQHHITADLEIPANSSAEVTLPGQEESFRVGSGCHHFEYDTKLNLKEEKYHLDMKLEELFADEKACKAMEEIQPGLSTNESLHTIKNFTIRSLLQMAKEMEAVFIPLLKALNEN